MPLVIRVFDVGHGDSLLVEFPDQKHIGVIDCHTHEATHRGFGGKYWDRSEPKILTYLRNRLESGKELTVAFVCLSHFHDDHYFGFGRLINELREKGVCIKELWDPGISVRKSIVKRKKELGSFEKQRKSLSELYDFYRAMRPLRKTGMIYEPLVNRRPKLRDLAGVEIDVLAPDSGQWDDYNKFLYSSNWSEYSKKYREHTDEHLVCSALMLRYGQARAILGADLTCRGWAKVVDSWGSEHLRSHAVKVSHHGSREGNFISRNKNARESLWEHISFNNHTVAVISGGYRVNLPHKDTITELNTKRVKTYCTGNFTRFLETDPIWEIGLPEAVCQHFQDSSEPVIENRETYHGDITIRVYDDGTVEPDPECKIPPL